MEDGEFLPRYNEPSLELVAAAQALAFSLLRARGPLTNPGNSANEEVNQSMKRLLIVIATCCLLAVPATAVGSTPTKAASASCKAQLKASGAANFALLYKSVGACVSHNAKLTAQQRQALLSAEKQCRAWQTANVTAFNTQYGTNTKAAKNGTQSNAFGKCVSKLASA